MGNLKTAPAILPDMSTAEMQSPSASASFRIPCLVLAGLATLIAVTRLHTYNEPQVLDITGYVIIGHELLAGRLLYSDLFDHKPPAIHVTYALAELLWGYGPRQIYLLGTTMAVLTMIVVCVAAAAPPWGRAAGLWAAAFWAVTSGSLRLEANQPNAEVFMNACLAGAFALLVWGTGRPMGYGRTVLAGLLFALASLYKHVSVFVPMCLGLALVVFPPDGAAGRRRALVQVAVMAGIGAAAWGVVFAYFQATGRFRDFYDAVFTYNRFYSNASNNGAGVYTNVTIVFLQIFGAAFKAKPLLLLAGGGFLAGNWAILKRLDRSWWLLAAYALGTHLTVQLPGRGFGHYFQLWLPVLAIGAAWGAAATARGVRRIAWTAGNAARLQHILGLLACVYLVLYEAPNYALSPDEWSNRKYDGRMYVEAKRMGQRIDRLLLPQERFYELTDQSGLYFASRRRPIAGLTFIKPILEGPLVETLTTRILAALEASPPELVVILREPFKLPTRLDAWLSLHYRPVPSDPQDGPFKLLVRRGGALEARLEAKLGPVPERRM
jgi:hypothetical protein